MEPMKSTGIVRKIDPVGRIVLPIELRKTLNIDDNDSELEIFVEENRIIMQKYQPCCIFCGNTEKIVSYKGKNVCQDCISHLSSGK